MYGGARRGWYIVALGTCGGPGIEGRKHLIGSLMIMMAGFLYQAGLNAVGPLITTVLGFLLLVVAANLVTRRFQDRRAANELKYGLISDMTETAGTLYHQIGMYLRAQSDAAHHAETSTDDQEVRELRKALLAQYPRSRAEAEVLQARLTAYFGEPRIPIAWHAVRDCLIVRYHDALGGTPKRWEKVCEENSKGWEGGYHSGLSASTLTDRDTVIKTYNRHLKNVARMVLACPVGPHRIFRKSERAIDRILEQAQGGFDYKEPVETTISPPD